MRQALAIAGTGPARYDLNIEKRWRPLDATLPGRQFVTSIAQNSPSRQ